jgi:acyl dehydratase
MTRYFEDVSVGDEVPPVERTPTVDLAIDFFGRHNPRNPVFGDIEAAKRIGLDGVLVPGVLKMSWICAFVGEWAGPEATFLGVRAAYRRPDVAGRPLVLAGQVVDKREDGQGHIVELEIVTLAEGQPSVRANVQVALPSRNG